MPSEALLIPCAKCLSVNRVTSARMSDAPTCGRCKATLLQDHPIALDDTTFPKFIERSDLPVVVDFWAAWCGPCRMFAPVFEQASETHADVVFGKVDTEAEPELAGALQISSIPTLMAFRDGILVFAQPGALPASALEDVIRQVRELDMDEVRKQLDEQPAR